MPEEKYVKTAEELLDTIIAKKSGGEDRPQQRSMVRAVEDAVKNEEHLVVQAGTGVGKTLGYLMPVVMSGKTAIISTATNQLSQQIYDEDLPVVSDIHKELFGHGISYALVKGRANYLCLAKLNELRNDGSGVEMDDSEEVDLFIDSGEESPTAYTKSSQLAREYKELHAWAKTTHTGDRAEAPAVSDEVWRGVSISSAECPGRASCPFGNDCFAEIAREKGQQADIVVTNHALVGADLDNEVTKVLGEKEVLVTDEMHELDSYLTSAWGTELSVKVIKDVITLGRKAATVDKHTERGRLDELEQVCEALEIFLEGEEPKRYVEGLPESLTKALQHAGNVLAYLASCFAVLSEQADGASKIRYRVASSAFEKTTLSIQMLLDDSGEMVQWLERVRVKKDHEVPTLFAAPLRIGPKLMQKLEDNNMTLIATSATITVGGEFVIPARRLALDEPLKDTTGQEKPHRPYHTLDVGSPFNYKKQGILYIPSPNDFAAPVGKERFEHTEDVKKFIVEAVQASKGRALILSTTSRGAEALGAHLRKHADTRVLIQGDMPAGRIVEEFREDTESTLVGTMGFWHGLNAPGETCSLVIIDKIPFKPMDDPLMSARQEDVVARGGNGFMDVYVAEANVMLAQGVGRLIRHTADRGVVAILDTRLQTKAYGKAMVRSIPDMYKTSNRQVVMKSLANI